ncbi:hypothetical protein AMS68_001645 [Peltaster fructicola]|uniref:Major facilitator superfamily (MFS) profile domain-containing protein n=1 Tax=Peltaster fructicola TaxID=286661 RepID=A0A6H0XND3_9PEZI|nr:hypothetical protein AMS68_001645 [Peltaster fructicola]
MTPNAHSGGLTGFFVYILIVSTIGPLLFGYHLAELNAPQDVITCKRSQLSAVGANPRELLSSELLPQCIRMTTAEFAAVTSLFTLGGLTGALASGPLSDHYGRLRVMLFTSIFFVLGAAAEALAINITIMTIGRFVSGIGSGASIVVVPLYIAECAPVRQRGLFGTFTQIMVNIGILIAQLLGYFLTNGSRWRIILGMGGSIGLAQVVGLLLGGQESPRWLAENGKPSKAKRALQKLRGRHVDIEEEVAAWGVQSERDLDDEEETLLAQADGINSESSTGHLKQGKRNTLGVFSVLSHPESRPAILAVVMIMLAQQFTGINSIVMYGVSLLADLLESNSSLLNILVAVLNIVTTTIAAPLVEKLGRKSCLLMSIAGMGINSVLLGIGIMQQIPILSAVAVLLFVASFGLGLGPVPFMLASELVGPEAVGATQSWALAANWIATFIVAQFFPILNSALGKGQVYFIFAAFALVFGVFTAVYVPETKGKRTPDEVWGRGKVVARVD